MGWRTGQQQGEWVGWTQAQIQGKAKKVSLQMARKAFDVVVASHANLRGQVAVKVMDRRASRNKIVLVFGALEANLIHRNGATVTIERNDVWQGSSRFRWYIIVPSSSFDTLLEQAGVAPEALHGWQAKPDPTPTPPMPPLPDLRDYYPHQRLHAPRLPLI